MAIADITPEQVIDILTECRNFNTPNQITGCLLFHNEEFLQILEGEEEIVLRLFEKIKEDPRHTHVRLISQGTILQKSFAQWSMAFHELKNVDFQKLNDTLELDDFEKLIDVIDKPTKAKRMFAFIAKDILEASMRFK